MNSSYGEMNVHSFGLEWSGDPRTRSWPLMQNPYGSIVLSLVYLMAVKLGMDYMSDKKPLNVRTPLIWYNVFLVLLNLWIFIESGVTGWFGKYNVFCQPVSQEASDVNIRMAFSGYVFFISKFIEFADTAFFIVRKRNDLVTRLHVIHHSILPTSCWTTVKYTPVGHSTFMGFANSFVHVLMYGYYAVTALGYRGGCYSFIKRNLTRIQMLQFILMFAHSTQILFNGCDFPHWIAYYNSSLAVLFLALFVDFYRSKYREKE